MISPIQSGATLPTTKNVQNREAESKTESSASSSRVQAIKESLQKGEYKLNLPATAEKMALNLLNRE
jgi:anti-sigma28 factor (negative regulator of flagellin synthesis)